MLSVAFWLSIAFFVVPDIDGQAQAMIYFAVFDGNANAK